MPKALSLFGNPKSFYSPFSNWYTKFVTLGINFHFTCGE